MHRQLGLRFPAATVGSQSTGSRGLINETPAVALTGLLNVTGHGSAAKSYSTLRCRLVRAARDKDDPPLGLTVANEQYATASNASGRSGAQHAMLIQLCEQRITPARECSAAGDPAPLRESPDPSGVGVSGLSPPARRRPSR